MSNKSAPILGSNTRERISNTLMISGRLIIAGSVPSQKAIITNKPEITFDCADAINKFAYNHPQGRSVEKAPIKKARNVGELSRSNFAKKNFTGFKRSEIVFSKYELMKLASSEERLITKKRPITTVANQGIWSELNISLKALPKYAANPPRILYVSSRPRLYRSAVIILNEKNECLLPICVTVSCEAYVTNPPHIPIQ